MLVHVPLKETVHNSLKCIEMLNEAVTIYSPYIFLCSVPPILCTHASYHLNINKNCNGSGDHNTVCIFVFRLYCLRSVLWDLLVPGSDLSGVRPNQHPIGPGTILTNLPREVELPSPLFTNMLEWKKITRFFRFRYKNMLLRLLNNFRLLYIFKNCVKKKCFLQWRKYLRGWWGNFVNNSIFHPWLALHTLIIKKANLTVICFFIYLRLFCCVLCFSWSPFLL